jgi:hypothetical protein
MKVNILGTDYKIIREKDSKNPKLKDASGYCELYSKKIVLCDDEPDEQTVENFDAYKDKVLRHEIIHAFLGESGLDIHCEWAHSEECVDWIARQFPKMRKAMEEANCTGEIINKKGLLECIKKRDIYIACLLSLLGGRAEVTKEMLMDYENYDFYETTGKYPGDRLLISRNSHDCKPETPPMLP